MYGTEFGLKKNRFSIKRIIKKWIRRETQKAVDKAVRDERIKIIKVLEAKIGHDPYMCQSGCSAHRQIRYLLEAFSEE